MSEKVEGLSSSEFSGKNLADELSQIVESQTTTPEVNKTESQLSFDQSLDRYIESSKPEHMEDQYALLQELSPKPDGESVATICIPLDIEHEDPTAFAEMIDRIQQANIAGSSLDVVIWANTKFDDQIDPEGKEAKASATAKYAALTEGLRAGEHNNMHIQTALQVLPSGEHSISQIRANYMEAVALDCKERNYGYDHPVIWLDADTTFVSKGSLDSVGEKVRQFDTPFVHTNLQYSADWATGTPLGQLDDATKAVVVGEIHRRQISRTHGFDVGRDYIEECGLAFAIGTYLDAGGVDTTDPINESARLVQRWSDSPGEIPAYLGKRKRAVPIFEQVKSARIGTSARRHRELTNQLGVNALIDPAQRYGDKLFTDMEKSDTTTSLSNTQITRLIEQQAMRNYPISEQDRKVRDKIADRLFPEDPEK